MTSELEVYDRWVSEGKDVAVATVVRVLGSAPRPEGSKFMVSSDGDMEGSVSGGCVENDVALHAKEVIASGEPKLVTYGIADEDAFEVGLTCGGTIQVFIEEMVSVLDALAKLHTDERLGAMATVVSGPDTGAKAVIAADEGIIAGSLPSALVDDVAADAAELMQHEQSRTLDYGEWSVFIESVAPAPILLIFGAGHIAQPLSRMAPELGFKVVVADARATWATPERFPDVDALHVAWPGSVIDAVGLDERTYVVLLSHDQRFEDPVFPAVRATPVRYIGALGSRRTHRMRVERLRSQGWTDDEIARIHAPIGIDIGAEQPAEVAVSILAEMIRVRYGVGTGLSLRGSEGRIHSQRGDEPGTA